MVVEKEEMTEWFKVINCKFIESSSQVQILLSSFKTKYNAVW